MRHPCVVGRRHLYLFPGKSVIVPKCHIDHEKGGLEVGVGPVVPGRQRSVVRAQGLPTILFVLLVFGDATPLEFDVSESPRTEVRYTPQLGNDNWTRAREIETVHEDAVDASERDVLDPVMPNDFRYEIHNRCDDIGIS